MWNKIQKQRLRNLAEAPYIMTITQSGCFVLSNMSTEEASTMEGYKHTFTHGCTKWMYQYVFRRGIEKTNELSIISNN